MRRKRIKFSRRNKPFKSKQQAFRSVSFRRRVPYTSPDRDLETLLNRFQIKPSFSQSAEREAAAYSSGLIDDERRLRESLEDKLVITIDGEDAKDFDDAISLECRGEEFFLGVHIADVSHFVSKNSELDREAFKRSTSTYLIDQVIPMLPFKLSNGLCSLVQGKKRLTLTCAIRINGKGEIKDYVFYKSIIENRRRCTYTEIQHLLEGQLDIGKAIKELIERCRRLKGLLRRKRIAEGGLDLETMEISFHLNEKGTVEAVSPKRRLESEQIVEEFMLIANRCAADFLLRHHTGIFRIHEPPPTEKLLPFHRQAKRHRLSIGDRGVFNPLLRSAPNRYQIFLDSIRDWDMRSLYSYLLLTSLNQACYSESNSGHYGLAFKRYTHFTSPIRRYPDLVVHRLISKLLVNKKIGYSKNALMRIAKQASARERLAVDAEREYLKIKSIRYMSDKIGQEFQGIITGMIHRGFFVREIMTGIEGFIDQSWLGAGAFYLENEGIYEDGKTRYCLADKIPVTLVSVNPRKLFIDFKPVF